MSIFQGKSCCGPRRLDRHQAARVSTKTLSTYQRHAAVFVQWLDEARYSPSKQEEFDDLLVEWKEACSIGKSRFVTTMCAVEFFFPRFKPLVWARAVAEGYERARPINHKVPMLSEPAKLWAAYLVNMGFPRMGLGLILQQTCGLRPSELLALTSSSILLPYRASDNTVIRLGTAVGTKAKREQFALLYPHKHAEMIELMRRLVACTRRGEKLFPYSYAFYLRCFKQVERDLGVVIGYTPHSPRAGFASERIAAGEDPTVVRREGRWASETSFKVYIDPITAAQVGTAMRLQHLSDAMVYVSAHLLLYFPVHALLAEAHGNRSGAEARPRGELRAPYQWPTTWQEAESDSRAGGISCDKTEVERGSSQAPEPRAIRSASSAKGRGRGPKPPPKRSRPQAP